MFDVLDNSLPPPPCLCCFTDSWVATVHYCIFCDLEKCDKNNNPTKCEVRRFILSSNAKKVWPFVIVFRQTADVYSNIMNKVSFIVMWWTKCQFINPSCFMADWHMFTMKIPRMWKYKKIRHFTIINLLIDCTHSYLISWISIRIGQFFHCEISNFIHPQ